MIAKQPMSGICLGLLSSGQLLACIKGSVGWGNSRPSKEQEGAEAPNRHFAVFTNVCSTGSGSRSQVVLQNHGHMAGVSMG